MIGEALKLVQTVAIYIMPMTKYPNGQKNRTSIRLYEDQA